MKEDFRKLLRFVFILACFWVLAQFTLPLGFNGMFVVQAYFGSVIVILLAIAFRVSGGPAPNDQAVLGTKALELLADNVKQVMTLTTAMIAITTTLGVYNKYAWAAPDVVKWMLIGSLGTYFLSIFFGIVAHGAIIEVVHQAECKEAGANIYDSWAEFLIRAQQVLFVVALFLTLLSALDCFFFKPPVDNQPAKVSMISQIKPAKDDHLR